MRPGIGESRALPAVGGGPDGSGAPKGPILVGGYMHSGTTLVQRILSRQRSIFCEGRETRYFEYLSMIRRRYANLSDERVYREYVGFIIGLIKHGYDLGGIKALRGEDRSVEAGVIETVLERCAPLKKIDHTTLYHRIFDALADFGGRQRWLEKTPANVFHAEGIVRSIPGARLVLIVRDPRDVLASKKTRRERVWEDPRYVARIRPKRHLSTSYDPVLDALSWKSAAVAARVASKRFPHAIVIIKYEDLVEDPRHEVIRLCRFLGLEFEEAMLDVPARGSSEWEADERDEGVLSDRVGRWSRVLKPAEVVVIQWLLKDEMSAFAYAPAPLAVRARLGVAGVTATSGYNLLQRVVRKWRLGGTSYLRNVLENWTLRLVRLVRD